ncbi:ABC transporter ATP-binding protein [Nocardioides nitrophenolicus]|uniref:ABC transporter ATP-binding protein n=1 Tax=Nocardioides nitrophenolicus TaxID=60489 RepID=UPI00195EB3D3|nr:ABC transporter ATP-binding protein [Nocardioides nitrophenolicus]MBM7518959.1 ABC-type lipoprotein export system ATPase subunit [Nocardioides nitrophenolicus]
MIELRGIGFAVATPRPTRILWPTDLDIGDGESVAIVGPSGAGKTTLASIVGALQAPSEGTYRFDGVEVTGRSLRELARFRSDHLGFVFQNSHLVEERTAQANVELGLGDPSLGPSERGERCLEALGRVGLADIATRRAADLSGGERHRVAIARALVKQPRVVIADEPTAALDQATGRAILELLAEVPRRGSTLVVVTHDVRAAEMADRVVRVVDGSVSEDRA